MVTTSAHENELWASRVVRAWNIYQTACAPKLSVLSHIVIHQITHILGARDFRPASAERSNFVCDRRTKNTRHRHRRTQKTTAETRSNCSATSFSIPTALASRECIAQHNITRRRRRHGTQNTRSAARAKKAYAKNMCTRRTLLRSRDGAAGPLVERTQNTST